MHFRHFIAIPLPWRGRGQLSEGVMARRSNKGKGRRFEVNKNPMLKHGEMTYVL